MQYNWQDNEKVSREEIARLIMEAEDDIANIVGYWPAPVWIEDEWHLYPRIHRREAYGTGRTRRGDFKAMTLNKGYVLYGGQRATEAIDSQEVAREDDVDADGDGFAELAHFTITNVSATFDVCSLKAYFKVYAALDAANCRTDPASAGADYVWEVRPLSVTLTGTTLDVYVPIEELIMPMLQETYNPADVDLDLDADANNQADNTVDTLLFYREYNNPATQVQFLWGESGCRTAACAVSVQTGCFLVNDSRNSIVVPQPGTYDAATNTFGRAS